MLRSGGEHHFLGEQKPKADSSLTTPKLNNVWDPFAQNDKYSGDPFAQNDERSGDPFIQNERGQYTKNFRRGTLVRITMTSESEDDFSCVVFLPGSQSEPY